MRTHKDLLVWKEALEHAKIVYRENETFPKFELYGLTSQVRRTAVSIASNIAEGAARNSEKEFLHFLYITSGSTAELETQWILATELEFTKSSEIPEKLELVRKLLFGLINNIKKKQIN